MTIRLFTLGGLACTRDGAELDWLGSQWMRAALLVHLTLERAATRDALVALFWPEAGTDTARRRLSQTVFALRKALGEDAIESHGRELRAGPRLQADALDFERAVAEGRYEEAIGVCRGPFLAGVHLVDSKPFEAWVDARRAKHAREFRKACRGLVDARVGAGDAPGAVGAAQAWVTGDPLDDEAQHRLIELLARVSSRTEALKQYDAYCRLLKAEELEPLDQTRELATAIEQQTDGPHLNAAPEQRVGTSPEPSSSAPADSTKATSTPVRTALRAGPPRRLTWARPLAGGVIVLLLLLGFAAPYVVMRDRDRATAAVPEAATRLAVLPFHAAGPAEVHEFGRGMVDLLTAALSDVGGIRTVPARTVLARVREQGEDAVIPLDVSLAIGRDVGAASVLFGSITAFGQNARLTAEIRNVNGGAVLAAAELTGLQDSILDLTDRLALQLLRELWRSRAPLPTARIAALTTSSPAALRAYLRGETHLREVRYDSAIHWLHRAVEVDSTFALAWLRLAEAGSYAEDVPALREYAARSLELADRLPERERSLARAENLRLNGSFEAFDSMASYVRRYPDDPIGWYKLGEIRYHAGYLGLFRDDEIITPYLQATRLDPALGVGLVHVLDMARDRGDRVTFDSAFQQFARVASPDLVERFRRQATVRWAKPDSVLSAFVAGIRDLDPVQERADINGMIAVLGMKARLDSDMDPMVFPEALDSLRRIFSSDRYFQLQAARLRMASLGAFGRAEAATQAIDQWLALEPDNLPPLPPPLRRAWLRVVQSRGGALPPNAVEDDVRILEENASALGWYSGDLYAYHMMAGDVQRANPYRPVNVPPPFRRQLDTVALRDAIEGFFAIVRGEANGLPDFDDALRRIGFEDANYTGLPWAELGHMLTRFADRREQGIRMLEWVTVNSAFRTGQIYLWLGRALEAGGDNSAARAAYSHVVRLWTGADPYWAEELEEARQALTRLPSERG